MAPPPTTPPPPPVEAKPPTSAEAMPATRPDVLPPIDVGAWMRVGGIFQGSDPSKLNDWHMDNAYVELHAGGKITQEGRRHAEPERQHGELRQRQPAHTGDAQAPGRRVEDAIISFDFIDEFHVWAGHCWSWSTAPTPRARSS